jgi:hypothetical protein
MKFNKWTLGLAAVGAVSLASAAKADEKMTAVQTAMSSTTISGYVDTSIQWNPGTGNQVGAPVAFQGPHKSDGFNLNVVQLSLAKPLDEAEWASGYRVDVWMGPDAASLASTSINAGNAEDFALRQAYVALRTPVGNGIDWKVGVFDTVVGYESLESGNNPNMTRSYGFTIEPTTHTGVLGSYRLNDYVSFSAGMANTFGPSINERAHGPNTAGGGTPSTSESYKAYMGSIALTAPDDWGWAAGSTLYGGIINGFSSAAVDTQTHYYLGGTLATPVAGLKVGASFDYLDAHNYPSDGDSVWAVAGYGSYQATEKLSFHGRAEYLKGEAPVDDFELFALTGTVQYDLWENVISRLEVRWDHCIDSPFGSDIFGGRSLDGGGNYEEDFGVEAAGNGNVESFEDYHDGSVVAENLFGGFFPSGIPGSHSRENAFLVALQFIYKF